MKLPFIARLVFNRYFFEKAFALASLAFFAWLLQDFLFVFLITFLFAFLFSDFAQYLKAKCEKLRHITRVDWIKKSLLWMEKDGVIVTIVYIAFIAAITVMVSNFIPKILEESKGLLKEIPSITGHVQWMLGNLQNSVPFDLGLDSITSNILSKETIESTVANVFDKVKVTGIFLGKVGIALVLSFVFLMDKEKITSYLKTIKSGNFAFLYGEYTILFSKIARGFGLIFKAQAIIAFVNAGLTTLGLVVISLAHGGEIFPYIAIIALTVFIMGFVPVIGFIISSLPMLLIGYNYGGAPVVASILVMVAIVHAIEAYYLNPKIVSSYTEFPVFITFLVLLLSEHFFGVIGFLIGIPLFYILLDLMEDVDGFISKIKNAALEYDSTKNDVKDDIRKSIRLSRAQGKE